MNAAEVISVLRKMPQESEVWVAVPGILDARDHPYVALAPVESIVLDGEGDIQIIGEES